MPKIQVRRGTGLELGDVIPAVGEPFYITDTKEYGYGDGINRIDDLATKTYSPKLHALKSYLDEGELLTDSEGLADIKSYAHSTFDLSKFTVAGSATITDDGIASGISVKSSSNIDLSLSPIKWTIISPKYKILEATASVLIPFAWGNVSTGAVNFSLRPNGVIGMNYNHSGGTGVSQVSSPDIITTDTDIQCKWEYNSGTITMSYKIGNADWALLKTANVSACTSLGAIEFSRINTNGCNCDLKTGVFWVDGVEVFSGNKTGIDTYDINGSTVEIPYTLSKTGSKVVSAVYRDRVQNVYEQFGYAPYYTLSDNDFTLPMGEIYGMIGKVTTDLDKKTDKSIFDGQWISSVYNVAEAADVRKTNQTFSLSDYLPDDGYNYEVIISASCATGNTSGNYAHVSIKTDIISAGENTSPQKICQAYTRANNSTASEGSTITVIGAGRTLTVYGYDSPNHTGTYNLGLLGYRRIGTNS